MDYLISPGGRHYNIRHVIDEAWEMNFPQVVQVVYCKINSQAVWL